MPAVTSSDGVRLVYDDIGPRDGTPVVLCHGLGAAGEQFAADAAAFAARGWRVLVPNLRGHGLSGKPVPVARQTFTLARMAQDLVVMLDHADVPPVHWVGNSLGGILALQLLATHESRFRTLATFGTAYRLDLPTWAGGIVPWSYRLFGARFNARLTALATTRDPAARTLIARLLERFDPAVGAAVIANVARYDHIAAAAGASLPILLLRGGRDGNVNAALGPTLKAMGGRPNFTRLDLPEGGHCANLDATTAWRGALVDFWDGR